MTSFAQGGHPKRRDRLRVRNFLTVKVYVPTPASLLGSANDSEGLTVISPQAHHKQNEPLLCISWHPGCHVFFSCFLALAAFFFMVCFPVSYRSGLYRLVRPPSPSFLPCFSLLLRAMISTNVLFLISSCDNEGLCV